MIQLGLYDKEKAFVFHLKDKKILTAPPGKTDLFHGCIHPMVKVFGKPGELAVLGTGEVMDTDTARTAYEACDKSGILFEPTTAKLWNAERSATFKTAQERVISQILSPSTLGIHTTLERMDRFTSTISSSWKNFTEMERLEVSTTFSSLWSGMIRDGGLNRDRQIDNAAAANAMMADLAEGLRAVNFSACPRKEHKVGWTTLLAVEGEDGDELVISDDVRTGEDAPWQVRVRSVGDAPYLQGLRVYERPNQSLAGNLIETANFFWSEKLVESIPLKDRKVRHLAFFKPWFREEVIVSPHPALPAVHRVLPFMPRDAEAFVQDPDSFLWTEDHGHHALILLWAYLGAFKDDLLTLRTGTRVGKDKAAESLKDRGILLR